MLIVYTVVSVAVFLLVFGILRTVRVCPAKKQPRPKLPAPRQGDCDRAAWALTELLKLSGDTDPRGELARLFPSFHQKATLDTFPGGALLYTWRADTRQSRRASAGDPILFLTQTDTLLDWKPPRRADGFVYGRGASGGKGHLAAVMVALERLAEENFAPTRDICVAVCRDTFSGSGAAHKLARAVAKKGDFFSFVLAAGDPVSAAPLPLDSPACLVGVAEREIAEIRLTAKTEPHGDCVPLAPTAAAIAAEALGRITYRKHNRVLSPVLRETFAALMPYQSFFRRCAYTNFKHVQSTPQTDALLCTNLTAMFLRSGDGICPPSAAEVGIRVGFAEKPAGFLQWLDLLLADLPCSAEVVRRTESSRVSDTHTHGFAAIRETCAAVFDALPVVPTLCLHETDARFFEPFCNAVFRFTPLICTPEDTNADTERVSDVALGAGVAWMRKLIETLTTEPPQPS